MAFRLNQIVLPVFRDINACNWRSRVINNNERPFGNSRALEGIYKQYEEKEQNANQRDLDWPLQFKDALDNLHGVWLTHDVDRDHLLASNHEFRRW